MALENADRCANCGTSSWEWEENPFAYAPVVVQCPGCMRRELLAKDDTPMPKGATIRLVPSVAAEKMALQALRDQEAGVSRRPIRRRNRG